MAANQSARSVKIAVERAGVPCLDAREMRHRRELERFETLVPRGYAATLQKRLESVLRGP